MKAFHEVRNYNSDLMVWYSGYENISFVAHWQKEMELVYIRSGEASFHVADQSFTAHAGDLVVCESGQIHYSDSYNTKNHLDFLIFDILNHSHEIWTFKICASITIIDIIIIQC